MKLIFDVEANALIDPTKIWVIATKDLLTGRRDVFRRLTDDPAEARRFHLLADEVDLWIGHNCLGYDWPVITKLLGVKTPDISKIRDTFLLSKLIDYPRPKHSVEHYGEEFGLEKINWHDYSQYSQELEDYCIRDVDITTKIYLKYKKYIDNPVSISSIEKEHKFYNIVQRMGDNGFTLNIPKVTTLLTKVHSELSTLDTEIFEAFPPRLKFIREVTPRETKHGTISLTSIPKDMRKDIPDLCVGAPFCYCCWTDFNPNSPKQIINVLGQAGWKPIEKTKGHIEAERTLNKLRRQRKRSPTLDLEILQVYTDLQKLGETGWKVNETNLSTLPPTAPKPARLLSQRIVYEARRRTLTEWKELVADDGRVHGKFQSIGAWTHRMSHQKPNMANITNAVRVSDGKASVLGKELRQCWIAPDGRLLVGVDAEAIQLRVFAHLINDPVLTDAIVNGNKKAGTDPHSLNKKYFGEFCKTRNAAKHSLYAMFFGGRAGKIAEIMDCRKEEAQEAIDALVQKYPGLARLQHEVFPADARRGYFVGLDGRKVRIPGETTKDREHLCMSGYLQNGEKVIMMEATIDFEPELIHYDSFLVDLVHDEWQNECPNDLKTCLAVAELECKALEKAGISLSLNIPIAGSYLNDHGDYTFGKNWYQTH